MTGAPRRWRRGLVLAGAALLAVPVIATAAPAGCAEPGQIVSRRDGWTTIAGPAFAEGGASMTAYAVDAWNATTVVVTNGTAITHSADGGCTWASSVLPRSGVPLPAGPEGTLTTSRRITSLAIPTSYAPHGVVWALGSASVATPGSPLQRAAVLVSTDHGATFTTAETGLPLLSRPLALAPTAAPAVAYLLLEDLSAPGQIDLYVTTDSGSTWGRVAAELPDVDGIAVDPVNPGTVWIYGDTGLLHSTDAGSTFAGVPGVPAPVSLLEVGGGWARTPVTLAAFHGGEDVAHVSGDGGRTFTALSVPRAVTSATFAPLGLGLALTSPEGVSSLRAGASDYLDISPDDATLSELAFQQDPFPALTGQVGVHGFHASAIYHATLDQLLRIPRAPEPVVVTEPSVTLKPPPKPRVTVPTIAPARTTVDLRPGERRRVPYTLALPPVPTPLDVYFITDSTGSMSSTIESLRENVQQIIDELASTGIDVWFGVGDFRDYPETGEPQTGAGIYPYRRHREVGPIDSDLEYALESISTGSGRGDDSALEAIYQSVTGAGRLRNPLLGPSAGYFIEPGQGAEFRPDALKVVIAASDEEFRHPGSPGTEPTYPGPTHDTVIDALQEHGVELLGLAVSTSGGGDPRPDLERVAEGAGTLAPPGGIDCDGDDQVDIDEGDPMVCDFTPRGEGTLAPAVVNLLQGVRDLAAVEVAVDGPASVVRATTPLVYPSINVKAYNDLTFALEVSCTTLQAGLVTRVSLSASSRGERLATGELTVRCVPVEGPVSALLPPVLVAAVPLPPPPPPPAPVPNVNPNVNPNPNPNPQANPNAGTAFEEEQAPMLALAQTEVRPEEELAMSSRRTTGPAPAAVAVYAALLAGAAVAHRTRHTHRYATTQPGGSR